MNIFELATYDPKRKVVFQVPGSKISFVQVFEPGTSNTQLGYGILHDVDTFLYIYHQHQREDTYMRFEDWNRPNEVTIRMCQATQHQWMDNWFSG